VATAFEREAVRVWARMKDDEEATGELGEARGALRAMEWPRGAFPAVEGLDELALGILVSSFQGFLLVDTESISDAPRGLRRGCAVGEGASERAATHGKKKSAPVRGEERGTSLVLFRVLSRTARVPAGRWGDAERDEEDIDGVGEVEGDRDAAFWLKIRLNFECT
jgi:hypothetical protein